MKIEIYDPALCCSSGVCGPSVDPALVRLTADLEWLKSKGIEVERFNLAQQPADFAAKEEVKTELQKRGPQSLPFAYLDGALVAAGFYPVRDQWIKLCGVPAEAPSESCGASAGACRE